MFGLCVCGRFIGRGLGECQWNRKIEPLSRVGISLGMDKVAGLMRKVVQTDRWTAVALAAAFACGANAAPVARWDFEDTAELKPLMVGAVKFGEPGPRTPEFPKFPHENHAAQFGGKGARLVIPDEGANSRFDFSAGDAFTVEAWVKLEEKVGNGFLYVVSKGRTHAAGFSRENQNWALRIETSRGVGRLNFLFTTKAGSSVEWHRWRSEASFEAKSGWHHVALTHRFGDRDSMRGWIDGIPAGGDWDMGGSPKGTPVNDDDAVWIGSSMGGSAGNSFRGWLDEVAIHRTLFTDEIAAGRFERVGGPRVRTPMPPKMPDLGALSAGRVTVTFAEGMPSEKHWPHFGEEWPKEHSRWEGEAFALPRVPLRFDDWGIRTGWKEPLLVRFAADVALKPGEREFLLRVRGLSRFWIDGKLVVEGAPILKRPSDGHELVTPVRQPPEPGLRAAGYHQQEKFGKVVIGEKGQGRDGLHRAVLEMVVGGPNLRVETGEICVAVKADGPAKYHVLTAAGVESLPLTDAVMELKLKEIECSLAAYDDRNRRQAAKSQDAYWSKRHEAAKAWADAHPAPRVPKIEANPVDAFVRSKISHVAKANSGAAGARAKAFHSDVLPVLREHCFRCHGEKDKGGIRLNSREEALKTGDSGAPALVPGDPKASELIARILTQDEDERMPPTDKGLSRDQIEALTVWVKSGAAWPGPPVAEAEIAEAPLVGDEAFLRRAYLDLVGVPPTAAEAVAFLDDSKPGKRDRLIDRLLVDDRFADNLMGEWLDLLGENPTLLNQSQGSTGPFRFFLHDSLRDRKPLDRMVTEFLMMRGGAAEGGSAGFAMAAENDAPFAAKGHIVASAFLGIELQCARCHDSPYHVTTQRDLFSLAAMFDRKTTTVPESSRVPAAFFEKSKMREPLIQATLKPGEPVEPVWPFAAATGARDGPGIDGLMRDPKDLRERLAALITAPENTRFAEVMVNRIWARLMGRGIVEPIHDWEGRKASHPDLLAWLARDLVAGGYDVRRVFRRIVSSKAYQRESRPQDDSPALRFFNGPERRRLTAEQIVDSLFVATGAEMDVEELTFVHDGGRALGKRQTLGKPTRAWMFASLNNERDRPSLSLPAARTVADVLQAFGWTGSRQMPVIDRGGEPNLLQPGVLANGVLTDTLTRASVRSELARLALEAESPEALVEELFLRILTRRPKAGERAELASALQAGFAKRVLPKEQVVWPKELEPLPQVDWFNHVRPDANTIQQEREKRVRQGPPPDPRLDADWRRTYEDIVWSLINHSEFVWMP